MLASPLLPIQPSFTTADDSLQYRPSKDKEAFNSLLPPPIEFVEGSSSGALAVPPGKYEPINASPKAVKPNRPEFPAQPPSTPVKSLKTPSAPSNAKSASLYPGGIESTWPGSFTRGSGLYNSGNTCFLNSALQCLLHTPPLIRMLHAHKPPACRVDKGFCMICSMRAVMVQSYLHDTAFSPTAITTKLHFIAKHLRRGRQEDSHEFLRYAIDALQKSCLAEYPQKIDPKLAETTWVHKIFGGQLRSRVTCFDCGHHSDTFDRILDLSVDIHRAAELKGALRKFIAVDYLKGADKYKCERCKKHVNAEKQFTLQEAPLVLTVHLKRFSPLGRKIGHHVDYDEHLSMQPYMSEDQFGPAYSLYGVICHAGGGPNSGHYYAFVKGGSDTWWEMNDDSVTRIPGPPVGRKNAYMLFYIRKKGQGLEAAVNSTQIPRSAPHQKLNIIGGMKKRKDREGGQDENAEDMGVKVVKPFIGPLLPSSPLNSNTSEAKRQKVEVNAADPQATLVKRKIEAAAAKARVTLTSLDAYASGSEDESDKEKTSPPAEKDKPSSIEELQSISSPPALPPSSPVSTTSFYGAVNTKKRKSPDTDADSEARIANDARQRIPRRPDYASRLGSSLNPFSRMSSNNHGKHRKPRAL